MAELLTGNLRSLLHLNNLLFGMDDLRENSVYRFQIRHMTVSTTKLSCTRGARRNDCLARVHNLTTKKHIRRLCLIRGDDRTVQEEWIKLGFS